MTMFRRTRRNVPELDTTSTADISFMLLIFFLVTSSMDTDWGLPRQLPQPEDSLVVEDLTVKQRNVMQLRLAADGRLTIDDEPATTADLTDRVALFVANADGDPDLPETSRREVHLMGLCDVSDRHVIAIDVDRQCPYEAYFDMQDALVAGYHRVRNQLARRRFGCDYAQCTPEQRDAIALVYPQRISETTPKDDGKEGRP